MSDKYIVVKFYENEAQTYEVFEQIESLLEYMAQEIKAGSKISVFKFGACIGDFS